MKIKKTIFFTLLFAMMSTASVQAVTIGPMQTKKERGLSSTSGGMRDGGSLKEDKLMAAFLKEDYAAVDKMTQPLLKRTHADSETDEKLYIRALSLMKLNRMEEARSMLNQLESEAAAPELKARAAYSLGDSYYFTTGDTAAYQNALNRYPFYEEAAMVRTRIRERQISIRPTADHPQNSIYDVLPSKPLQQMGIVEAPLYSVQVGSFSNQKNAKQLVSKLLRVNYDAKVMPDDARNIFRVRVGSFVSKHDALILERKLKKEGYPTKIVP